MKKITELTHQLIAHLTKSKKETVAVKEQKKAWKKAGIDWRKRNKTIKPELQKSETLEKSGYRFTTFDNGALKMEFGEEVPEIIKKRAKAWAEKRGLSIQEASLGKSANGIEWVIFK